MTSLGDRIREARERKGWTQTDLAEAAGFVQAQVSDWEVGRWSPKARNLRRLAVALDVSADYLLGLDDRPD